jgi:NAD(P)-dependent dehydrogenase (short-subunit alcohol dehydrogenase family)
MQVHLVTGATDGIGKQTAIELAKRGARVLVHGRSEAKARLAADDVRKASGSDAVEPIHCDLASLAEVRACAERVLAAHEMLDVLVNNAGVFMHERVLTADGFETTMAVNHFSHFLLTHLLLPLLERAPRARVIHVSSGAHRGGALDFSDLTFERGFGGYAAYATSKLANILFSNELARRLAHTRITSNALHPGVITTKLLREGFGSHGDTLERGARTTIRVATDPALAEVTGKYFSDEREAQPSKAALDRAAQTRLYDLSATLTGATPLPLPK